MEPGYWAFLSKNYDKWNVCHLNEVDKLFKLKYFQTKFYVKFVKYKRFAYTQRNVEIWIGNKLKVCKGKTQLLGDGVKCKIKIITKPNS